MNYRIDQLEKKVDAYEKAKDHLCGLEEKVEALQEQVRALNTGIEDREVGRRRSGNNENRQVGFGVLKTFTFRNALSGEKQFVISNSRVTI